MSRGLIAPAAYLVWPTWERTQAFRILAQMLDAYRAYFHAVAEAHFEGTRRMRPS